MANERLEELTKELLEQLYVKEQKSLRIISKTYNITRSILRRKMITFDFYIKNSKEIKKNSKKLLFLTYDTLQKLHWDDKKSMSSIGKMFNIPYQTVIARAKDLGVNVRNRTDALKLSNSGENSSMKRPEVILKIKGKNNANFGKKKSDTVRKRMSDAQIKYNPSYEELYQLYWIEEKSLMEISKIHKVSVTAVSRRIKKIFNTRSYRESARLYNSKNKNETKSLNTKIRKLSEYNIWRACCYIRDQRTCQVCRAKKIELNVDHIIPLSFLIKKNNITTLEEAISCQELWDIENGRVLCIKCHKGTETFGYKAKNYSLL